MKKKKFMRCICCGGFSLHRIKGWWIHQTCEGELKERLLIIKYEMPLIQQQLLLEDLGNAVLVFLSNPEKIPEYRKELWEKAWKKLEDKYGRPSWQIKGAPK